MKRLSEVVNRTAPGYLIPLFWIRGEEESVLRHMIGQMHDGGIEEFVVESRPHPDYLGERWWRDVDIVLDEAKRRNMRVWFFDDTKFPSGYSAGKIRDNHPEYLKIYLEEGHVDAVGPRIGASVFLNAWVEEDDELIGVVAARRTDGLDTLDYESLTDISQYVSDGILYWDVPEGNWRIFILVATRRGGEEGTKDYLNPLEKEPVQAFLHYVYEAHYEHYQNEFGKTIAGFFSDEPRFGNLSSYEAYLGCTNGFVGNSRPKVVLPWSKSLLEKLNGNWQGKFKKVLPCLWYDAGEHTADVRYTYMDLVSRLFGENYTQQIGDWCRAHHVKYMGHLIEDNGAHARLGYGAGHFFRAIHGQDYPGLDIIHQVWPEVTDGKFTSQVGYLDADFYYWGLTKMASSAAHITSQDSGRTMCELFGAYGWQAGLRLMKWLTDHVCVRGVNCIVPHAFTCQACDWDAPPHFYDRGLNPQWRYFPIWAAYANRICHLLSGGVHVATAAVLYHAEAEWAGEYMPFELPVKALLRKQIDCDVVPVDAFTADHSMTVKQGCFQIGGEIYRTMVVPYAQRLPEEMLAYLLQMADAGIPVLFTQDYPSGSPLRTENCEKLVRALRDHAMVQVCNTDCLADKIMENGIQDISLTTDELYLRCYHYNHPDAQLYFLVNESISKPVHTSMTIQTIGTPYIYDAMENSLVVAQYTECEGTIKITLDLEPYQSCFVILCDKDNIKPEWTGNGRSANTNCSLVLEMPEDGWMVSTARAPEITEFSLQAKITGLGNVAVPGLLPAFTGTIRYMHSFELTQLPEATEVILDLGEVHETAEVWINDIPVGTRIAPPYWFRAEEFLKKGKNTIRVDVTNTLAKERGSNLLDRDMVQDPSGLLGPVRLLTGGLVK